MKTKVIVLCACIGLTVLAGCDGKGSKNAANMAQADSLRNVISQKDTQLNDMMGTLNEIQDGFSAINEAEGRVNIAKDGESANKAQQIRDNVQFISNTMKHNKELISKLQQQLRNSNVNSGQMKKMIDSMVKQLSDKDAQLQKLREELDAKDIHISELDETINDLNTNVSDLKTESTRKTTTINNQDKQLNTAWFVFGTKKELKDQGILQGSKVLQSNFNASYFTKIDIRVDKEVKLYSTSAKVLTTHPSSSYTLTRDANKQYVLRITNPQIFWSTSKYLVVLVK